MFFLVIRNSSNKHRIGDAALIRGRRLLTFFVPDAALIRGRRLVEGGAYSSKYGSYIFLSLVLILLTYAKKLNFNLEISQTDQNGDSYRWFLS